MFICENCDPTPFISTPPIIHLDVRLEAGEQHQHGVFISFVIRV